MLTTLFINLCILIACSYALTFTYRRWPMEHRGPWYGLRLAGLAATGILLMHFPAPVAPGVFADLRVVPLVFALRSGGPLAGPAVALPIVLYRLHLGGAGAPIMVISAASILLVGLLMRHLGAQVAAPATWPRRVAQFTVMLLPNSVGLLLLPDGQALLAQMYLPVLLLSVVGAVVLTAVVESRLTTLRLLGTLEGQALHDALTGLPNRRQFERDLATLQLGDALLMVDVDHFKRLNDTHGHAGGDAALREVAQLLGGGLRRDDRAYRYGGEEFAVILRGVGAGQLHAAADRLRQAVGREPLVCVWEDVTVSVGAAVMVGGVPGQVVAQADQALYCAKAGGRNRTMVSGTVISAGAPEQSQPLLS